MVAIKVAPFNRYRTLDVVRGVVAARAEERVALYTGNDDHIVLDLVTPFAVRRGGEAGDGALPRRAARPLGGLDPGAVRCSSACKAAVRRRRDRARAARARLRASPTATAPSSTSRNDFRGCIAGCHEVLRRQGLLEGIWCLDPQRDAVARARREEIDRVCREHADLSDDAFVRENLQRWLS